jgi:Phage capsid family
MVSSSRPVGGSYSCSAAAWVAEALYMHPTVALKLKTTLDSSNRPVLLVAPYTRTTEDAFGGSGRPLVIGTILGFPVYLSKNMPTFAAGRAGVALFGDFDHGLVWRQAQGFEVQTCGWWGNPPRGFESLSLRVFLTQDGICCLPSGGLGVEDRPVVGPSEANGDANRSRNCPTPGEVDF